jgi:hypothetical protein
MFSLHFFQFSYLIMSIFLIFYQYWRLEKRHISNKQSQIPKNRFRIMEIKRNDS